MRTLHQQLAIIHELSKRMLPARTVSLSTPPAAHVAVSLHVLARLSSPHTVSAKLLLGTAKPHCASKHGPASSQPYPLKKESFSDHQSAARALPTQECVCCRSQSISLQGETCLES